MQRIQNFFARIGGWWKRQRLTIKIVIIIALVIALFVALGGGGKESLSIETAKRQDLARSITATGTVVSTTDLSLSFQETNLVRSINVAVGDKVYKGQVLATLANASEAAAVAQASAKLLSAQAAERKAAQGSGDEEIRSAEIKVANARRTLYSSDLVAKDDDGSTTNAPVITGTYNGAQSGVYRIEIDRSINEARYSGLEAGRVTASSSAMPMGTRGLLIKFGESNTYSIGDEWTVDIPNKDGDDYTANLNAYNAALADLELKKTVAPSDVEGARADVAAAQAALASAQADYEKTVIRAPASGTVTKVDIKLGQLAEMFVPVISIQDVSNLYVEANVNESSISNLELGQSVQITYDALGKGKVFSGTLTLIDIGATVEDGIVNYKVKAVVPDPADVRPGMTANLSVQTAFAPAVIVVPERVIESADGRAVVRVLIDERKMKTEPREVVTGLRGDGGLVEIVSGLLEGERVVFSAE